MGQSVCRKRQNLASPSAAYERAFALCRQAVTLEKESATYIGAAIDNLTRKGEFGSWLWKLFHRKKVTIHLHYYERLIQIVEDLADQRKAQSDHLESMIQIAKGKRDASDTRAAAPAPQFEGVA